MIIHNESMEDYLGHKECISSHLLNKYIHSPSTYKRYVDGEKNPPTPAMKFGSAAHKLILEGDEAFQKSYAIGGPINPSSKKPYKPKALAWTKHEALIGKTCIPDEDMWKLQKMRNNVLKHKKASILLEDGESEVVIRLDDFQGLPAQCRLDRLSNAGNGIVDLKTTASLTYFESDCFRFGYARQVSFYNALYGMETGLVDEPVHIIAVENAPPHEVGVWRITKQLLAKSECEMIDAIVGTAETSGLLDSIENNWWPTGYETIRMLG